MAKVFFVDFDGTITTTDTCWAMVQAYAREGWEELDQMWANKEISTEECARRTFALFDTTPGEIQKLLESMEIDPHFIDFLNWCRDKDYPVYILSDGYDFNIQTILNKYQIDIPYYANKMVYHDGFHIECPYVSPSCGDCGTCKTELMQKLRPENSQAIYIGDGYSDTCPAAHADIVFAKGTLYKYCQDNHIPARAYQNFADILAYLNK
jgi:2-hydroxy-3-keto-5-methylthiopentenyl-1-phosphate phosphatase